MKDLDFDELDRAVNSLMTNVPRSAPAPNEEKEKTLDITSTLDADASPQFDRVEKEAAKAAADSQTASATASQSHSAGMPMPAPSPAVTMPARSAAKPQSVALTMPANRRAGRFMDVVHPSSDMKKPEAPAPHSSVSRQGTTIKPMNTITATPPPPSPPEETPQIADPAPEQEKAASASLPPEPRSSETPPASDWPDPLDMMQSQSPDTAQKADEHEEASSPITSPFLPDTKVEKRPLGGSLAPESVAPEEPDHAPVLNVEEEPKTTADPNDQLPANPTDVEVPLPEELQGDLMAVEADTTHDELKQAHESGVSQAEKEGETVPVSKSEKASVSPSETASSGPTSIPQQYREEPSTGDQNNGAIYDTDTYHQPLAHPAKKKSGWLVVVWIVAVLLLGAGGGAVLYFLGLV